MTEIQETLLTVPDIAERLQMTPDGVYKLIQRGHLETVRLSARKLRVRATALTAYLEREAIELQDLRESGHSSDPATLRDEFVRQTGATPEDWLAVWKRDEIEDTPENMELMIRAVTLRQTTATGHQQVRAA